MSERDVGAEIRTALTDPGIQGAVPKATRLAAMMRRQAVEGYPGYEEARDRARAIKEDAIERLPELLEQVRAAVRAGGGEVHDAVDGPEACRIITEIAAESGVRRVVKSKSMTSEEIHLNDAFLEAGIEVRETDLGEYIVQLDGDRPSHIIAPIIHKTLEDVRDAFRKGLGRDDVPERAEELTQLARQQLRADFLAADMGLTGANFVVADSGAVVVVENEGNARLCTQLPRVHVALAGVEKLIPRLSDLATFMQLLPRSGTGQLMTSYLSILTGPGWGSSPLVRGPRRFHLVLLDNGRMKMRDDPLLREALYCLRCGACLNVCTPYQAVGGHVYGGPTYQSGIGNAWEAGVRGLDTAAEFNFLCSTCTRCRDVCPVHIDIPWMNSALRGQIRERQEGTKRGLAARLLEEPVRLYELARRARAFRWLGEVPPARWAMQRLAGIDARRPLPVLPPRTLREWFDAEGGAEVEARGDAQVRGAHDGEPGAPGASTGGSARPPEPLVFWADCHTNHVDVEAGKAAMRVLGRLGFAVSLHTGRCCGRAAVSQGNLAEARRQAGDLRDLLEPLARDGVPVVGLESSCVSCVRHDHQRLLSPEEAGAPVPAAIPVRELFEFLAGHGDRIDALIAALPAPEEGAPARQVVVHGHCQQKTAGWLPGALAVLAKLPGVQVQSTMAECCGMAGSFGFKTASYDVSHELGQRLIEEVGQLEVMAGEPVSEVLAFGTSCRGQFRDFGSYEVRHPVQLLEQILTGA